MRTCIGVVLCCALGAGCSRSAPETPAPAPSAAAPAVPAPHYGEVMAEVGRRFELAGRAAKAGRFALAEFELGEMEEAIDEDLPHAEPPRAGDPAKLAALLGELRHTQLPAMQAAAKKPDTAAFALAFAAASKTCNACHDATEHSFIEIPSEPGRSVPLLDPIAAPAASASASASAAPVPAPAPAAPATTSAARPIVSHPPIFRPPPRPPPIPDMAR